MLDESSNSVHGSLRFIDKAIFRQTSLFVVELKVNGGLVSRDGYLVYYRLRRDVLKDVQFHNSDKQWRSLRHSDVTWLSPMTASQSFGVCGKEGEEGEAQGVCVCVEVV